MELLKKIDVTTAAKTMIALLSCVLIFHVFVLVGVIPYDVVWGGRLKTSSQMYSFESVSITVNFIMILAIAMRVKMIPQYINGKVLQGAMWFLVALFLLNTLGNIFSLNKLETILATPMTLISAVLCCRVAIGD